MTPPIVPVSRRTLLAGLGGAICAPWLASAGLAQSRPSLALQARAGTAALRPGAETACWLLASPAADGPLRFRRGDEIDVALENQLPIPVALNWTGQDGAASAEPLLGRPALAAGGKDSFKVRLRHAGTAMIDTRLLGDGQALPSPARALVVQETEAVATDRDEVLLIEDFRLRPDGTPVAPGVDPKDAEALFTVNGKSGLDLTVRAQDRLRIRFINGCQRNVIAIKIEYHEVRVMAIDGQPAEPFLARNGQLVLAPGTRIDVFVDATKPAGSASTILLHDGKQARPIGRLVVSQDVPARDKPQPPAAPLPGNGLPAQLDLKNAQRIDLTLGAAAPVPDWIRPADLAAATVPSFRAKTGRTVVLALTNRAAVPSIFHLHGHHFRLLDRLDDGWKPFWLDTLAIDAGQTQRIAFAAEHPGRFLMEAMATDWAAPRLVRWYEVG
ncbi:MAG: copper oxidase [Tardiphaga sp.]|uniref:multicopper oxidase family protein n=1 Tax=Tardiphaga sp. TaxID=1926292 RepID=UPI002625EA9A|nr:multicopper oxidase domain-containing protein [Tardiphaga sp.]MDB5501241.1 copper oxidase [Tardiphaga sp.]